MVRSTNENICPICQQENKCMAHQEQACWCNDERVPQQLIDLIPKQHQDKQITYKQCICKQCIKQFSLKP